MAILLHYQWYYSSMDYSIDSLSVSYDGSTTELLAAVASYIFAIEI